MDSMSDLKTSLSDISDLDEFIEWCTKSLLSQDFHIIMSVCHQCYSYFLSLTPSDLETFTARKVQYLTNMYDSGMNFDVSIPYSRACLRVLHEIKTQV